ncbi:MAG: restriction endonuclease subunit S [Desulfuromonadales bacterium]|nr:restriction endonuclease subunit S [Desulfuromonadales bacterium]
MNPGVMMASHEGTKTRRIETRRLRFLFDTKSGATPSSGVEEYWDGDINWVTPEDLGKLEGRYVQDTRRRISEDGYKNCGVSLAPANSLVLSKRAPIGQVAILSVNATCNQGCFLLTKQNGVDERFYYYALLYLRPLLEILGRGSTFMELSADDMRSVRLPFPEEQTQRLITDYLDRETARIDALVAEKEKMLALLEEKRAALISRAVTRGLDESAPLKPSGLDWLGDIPAHWETKKLKHVASLRSGETITADSISDTGDYPVYGGNGFRGFTSEYTHVGDYVLIGRQGALCGNINYASGQFWASEHAVVATIKLDDDVFWLGELLIFMNLNQYSQSAAQPGISVEVIENLKIPVPPATEQVQIAAYMKKESDYIDAIRDEVSKTTALLKERRAALITAAVTGQIPVEEMRP